MENSQTGGKTWGIPFQRSTIVLYWNKEAFRKAGLDPNKAPANWKEMAEYAQKATKRDAAGKATQWGVQIPSSGFPYWLFQGLAIENGRQSRNAAGHRGLLRQAGSDRRVAVLGGPREEGQGTSRGHRRLGTTPKDFFEAQGRDDLDDHRQPHQRQEQRQVRFRRRDAAGGQAAGSPTGGGNFYIFKKSTPAQRDAAFKFIKWVTTPARAAQWGIDTGYVAVRADAWDTPAMKQYVAGFPAARLRATSCRLRRPSCRRTTTSASPRR
jgi:sn-glycerol 3-phosphate transport system substrate-binding protein